MKRVAGVVCGLTAMSGGLAGCGDEGGAISNSFWRLWSSSTASYTDHPVVGQDGDSGNTVECSNDGSNVIITLRDAGEPIDADGDGVVDGVDMRMPGFIEIRATLGNPSDCSVTTRENSLGGGPALRPPTFNDTCAPSGGCQLALQATENDGLMGTLTCTQLTQSGTTAAPLVLAGRTRDVPMTIQLEGCN